MKTIIIFNLLVISGLVLAEPETSETKDDFEYVFSYPRSVLSGSIAKGCLTLKKAALPVEFKVRFTNHICEDEKDKSCDNVFQITKVFECVDINIPLNNNEYAKHASLTLELTVNGKTVTKVGPEDVRIYKANALQFMETDRNKYKPGDTVKVRMLGLKHNLKPDPSFMVNNLVLRNPSYNKVKSWQNVSSSHGLIQLEFQLPENAEEGGWNLQTDNYRSSSYFTVQQYMLPRFKTTLTNPNSFYIDDKSFDVDLCAKYSYGRNVKGVGVIKLRIRPYGSMELAPLTKSEKLKNGCVHFKVPLENLNFNRSLYYNVELSGSVTEQGTEEVQSESGYMYVNKQPYNIHFDHAYTKLKTGLPFFGSVKIVDERQVKLTGKHIRICYKYENDGHAEELACKELPVTENESVQFTVPPLTKITSGSLTVEAKFDNETDQYIPSIYLHGSHSISNNSVLIHPQEKESACGDSISAKVMYTLNKINEDKLSFYYLVMSRFDVVKTGEVQVSPKKKTFNPDLHTNVIIGENRFLNPETSYDEFQIDFDLDKIYTTVKLIVYTAVNGELIADEATFEVKRCLPNKVTTNWEKHTLEPGQSASLKISTGKSSMCAISAVDKATTFSSGSSALTPEAIVRPTEWFRRPYHYQTERECILPKDHLEQEEKYNGSYWIRWYPESGADARNIFNDASVGVISSEVVVTKKCRPLPMYPSYGLSGGIRPAAMVGHASGSPALSYDSDVQTIAVNKLSARPVTDASGLGGHLGGTGTVARTFFPETWLWDLAYTGEDQGTILFERNIPDSITNWITNVLCISDDEGVGMSPPLELNVFKPFFVDVLMPHSIKRKTEILHLPVAIFNYQNHSIPVRLTLGDNDGMELVDGDDKKTTNICVEAGDSVTHIYRIRAIKLGSLNVSVSAELDPAGSDKCGEQKIVVKRDLVYKATKVVPEGYPSQIVKSALLCANDTLGSESVSWEINLPEDVVEDTVEGQVTINSDILGPVIENMEDLLRVPSGCGEQIMAGLTPNLYVMRYLKSNNLLTDEISKRALKNMETGYQKILGYKHPDGSFSAFGNHDKGGSMFLTAFVVRTLRQMQEYMDIDNDVIDKAVGFIMEHQMSNGCFDPVSHVFHKLGDDGDKDNQTTSLTSYVLISLLETNINVTDDLMAKAKECIFRSETANNYTLAVSAYALELMGEAEKAAENLNALLEAADREGDLRFWKQQSKYWYSLSNDVEVTGYALLALLQTNTPENIGAASSLVRWLQTKMNPTGGYISTQDTVVALDGISRFANVINKKEPHVDLEISTKQNGKDDVKITKRDRNSKNEIPLVTYPELINVKVRGDGCVLGQAAVKFNVNKKANVEALKLTVETKSSSKGNQCSMLEVKPCVSYDSKQGTNMALLEITMPSGYIPDESSLFALRGSVEDVKKFELIENRVVLYFDKLTSKEICAPFAIEQKVVVENIADPIVKVYDYYTPELTLSKSYKLPVCESNNSIEP